MSELTHFDSQGRAKMVDVGDKERTVRVAVAAGAVHMAAETLARIQAGTLAKGDVLAVAQVAAIMGAKKTADLIPMCHPLALEGVKVTLEPMANPPRVEIRVEVRVEGRTGVEMEALTGVSAAALTLYDMCKAIDRGMIIQDVRLLTKSGGRSGDWQRAEG